MKKRILILIPTLRIGGGAEKVASSLTLKLSKKYNIFILTFFHFKNLYHFKGTYYSLKENLHFGRLIFRLFNIYKFIKIISPDIIISFMDYTSLWVLLTKYLFSIKIPLIVSIRNNPNLQYMKIKKHYKLLIKKLYPLKRVNSIVAVSKEIREILIREYKIDKQKIITIYNGVDLKRIKNLANKRLPNHEIGFDDLKIIKFINIGSLLEKKGHEYLIKAYSKVINKIPNSKLFILGDGPLRTQLENLINRKQLKNKVVLLGKKNNLQLEQ